MPDSMKGKQYPSEKAEFKDKVTGATMWQMTSFPANHHNIYMTKSCFTNDNKTTVFLSKRTGFWNLFKADIDSGRIIQMTDFDKDIDTYSHGLLPDGRAYGVVDEKLFTIDVETLEEKILFESSGFNFGGIDYACNHHSGEGRFLVTKIKDGNNIDIILIPTDGSPAKTILKEDHPKGVAYMLITPDEKHIVHHKAENEIWCIDTDGSNNRPLYAKDTDIWTTHPVLYGNDKVIFSEWPDAIKMVDINDLKVETICEFNGWHMGVDPDGTKLICDTTNPDTGLWEVDIKSGEKKLLCKSDSYFPKIESREGPWLDLWAHPHPSYSPDGKMVMFNSCMDKKHTQIYIALIEE